MMTRVDLKMSKKKNDKIGDFGIFNVLLIGDNPYSVSIADNIKAAFAVDGCVCKNPCLFNIIEDIGIDGCVNRWFNEFIYSMATTPCHVNIVISKDFHNWNLNSDSMERLYMKKLLQSMNTIIVDVSDNGNFYEFDSDIPQFKFDSKVDFLDGLIGWIDEQMGKMAKSLPCIRLINSLCGKTLPFIGDVFGCFSEKKYVSIVKSDQFRFNSPILFDEFCHLMRGRSEEEMEGCVVTRTNSALGVFFK